MVRAKTRGHHDEAEKALGIMDPDLTLDIYIGKLAEMYALYLSLSPCLGDQVDDQLQRLKKDLTFFGANLPAALAQDEDFVDRLRDPDFREGVMYVIEGSALGGQVVSRHLREHLGIMPDAGGAFFFGAGPATFANWRQTLARLARLDEHLDRWGSVLAGAERTFEKFSGSFHAGAKSTRGTGAIPIEK